MPEALIAIVYRIFEPNIIYARLLGFIFFLGSAYYLYKIVKLLLSFQVARITFLIYLILPLGLYYSRAVQIDFFAIFFAHGMLFYLLSGYDGKNILKLLMGSFFGTIAFLIKSPYTFYLFFPLGYYITVKHDFRYFVKTLPILFLPVFGLILWRQHTLHINGTLPDWLFIPDYTKMTEMGNWYFGNMHQRFSIDNWIQIGYRIVKHITTFIGFPLFVYGFLLGTSDKSINFFKVWFLSTIIYLFIFFNLNLRHDYYQLPLLAIGSFFIALTINQIMQGNRLSKYIPSNFQSIFVILLLFVNSIWIAESNYYTIDWVRISAGVEIQKSTEKNSLIIASIEDAEWNDPRLLYRSLRDGWSINLNDLNDLIIKSLKKEGANYLAVVAKRYNPVESIRDLISLKKIIDLNTNDSFLYLYTLN